MSKVWVVRADGGHYAQHFVQQGYVGIDWNDLPDLSGVMNRAELADLYHSRYTSSGHGAAVDLGQIGRFVFDIRPGDYVVTPSMNPQVLHYGVVDSERYYFTEVEDGGSSFHRLRVKWSMRTVRRDRLTKRLQKNLRGMLTVFQAREGADFLRLIGAAETEQSHGPAATAVHPQNRPKRAIRRRVKLSRIRRMDPFRFEELVGELLQAMGLEEVQVTKKTGDGGVDVTGIIPFHGLAREDVFVQVKRQQGDVHAQAVRQLRAAIKYGGRGIFVTTSGFDKRALDVAREGGFPPIGLVDGRRLLALLDQYWDDISPVFQREIS